MSEENWISSKEAVLHVRRAGWTEGDLAQWAENGQLRSRAARLQSSDDDDLLERELAPPSDAKELQRELEKRALSGSPWPDIPADFWYWFNRYSQSREAQWAAGVFSTKVHFETQLGPHEGSLTIRLLDVTFCAEDLAELLGEKSSSKLRGTLSEATGATALVVHHAGKDATRGARGWSGIKAAADAELEVSRTDARGLLKITKMKDGNDGRAWGFRLNIIDLGIDADGDRETSCVVEYMPAPPKKLSNHEPKGARQRDILNCARQSGAGTSNGALIQNVIDECVDLIPFEKQPVEGSKERRDQRRGSVMRALDKLCEQGFLKTHDDRLYLPNVGPE